MLSTRLHSRISAGAAATAALLLGLLGCTQAESTSPGSSLSRPTPTIPSIAAPSTAEPAETTSPTGDDGRPFGPGCSSILGSDASTLELLSASELADAVAKSPALSRLQDAIERAGLAQQLNSPDGATLLAPDDEAFSRLSRHDAARLLTDRSTLVRVVKTHVLPERLGPDQLPGRHRSLSGATISASRSGDDFTIDTDAHVVCGNIRAANATIYVIDRVLMPN